MALAHNCILRALNSILLQAPHIPTSTEPGYRAQDVADLLFYTASYVNFVEHHHHAEETRLFPGIKKVAGQPGLMEGLKRQHATFWPGLEGLLAYTEKTKPMSYRWEGEGGTKAIIDGFATAMTEHLYEEVEVLLSLGHLDNEGLKRCGKETEDAAKASGTIEVMVSGERTPVPSAPEAAY